MSSREAPARFPGGSLEGRGVNDERHVRRREADRSTRTFLRAEPEHERLEEAIEGHEPEVGEVDKVPLREAGELRRDERGAHRADTVDGVHEAHLH